MSAEYPEKLTPELREVLGLMIFTTAPIGRAFRDAGEDIPPRVEDEQAFVLHWLIGLALEHGPEWRRIAAARVDELAKIASGHTAQSTAKE